MFGISPARFAAVVTGGSATWSQIGTATSATGADPLNVNVPTGVANGDFLLAFQSRSGSSPTIPTGFTSLGAGTDGDGSLRYTISYRVASSEPASYQFENGVTANEWGAMMAFRSSTGLNATPQEGFTVAAYSSSASPAAPSVTASLANSLLLSIFECSDTANETINSGPAGMTQEAAFTGAASQGSPRVVVYSLAVNAGATGTQTITWGHTEWGYKASLVLRPT